MKKLLFLLIICLLSITSSTAQMRWNQRYQQYIDQYKDIAIEQMLRWKIPASITLAQGLFESGAGLSRLAVQGNNHFGIKCNGWEGRKIYEDDVLVTNFEPHVQGTSVGFMEKMFGLKVTDYKGWAKGLKNAGYATNPQYANKLIEIIQLYKLYQYDNARNYDKFMIEHTKDHSVNGMALHPIKIYNKNYYIIARKGDTFKGIGEEIGISYGKIAKYNERGKRDQLVEGEIIWLKKKQKKAPKDYKGRLHYVRNGESMYTIAQKYGIRLKNLYKMNHLSPDYEIRVGDGLKLR